MARNAHDLVGVDLDACERSIERTLSTIADLNPDINAFAYVDDLGAHTAIAQLARLESSESAALQCVPVGVKDLIDVFGMPTRANSRVIDGGVVQRDALVVERLRRAGAIPVGKTHTQEFAYGVVTPQVSNPVAPGYITGGSSGGSAAAVAAGMVPLAIGTDTAGSVRIPAALCGVVGLKPRSHVVPLDGIIPLAPSMDSCGPLARSVEEVGHALRVMADLPSEFDERIDIQSIGVLDRKVLGPMDQEVQLMLEDAVRLLTEEAGLQPHEVRIRPLEEWAAPRSVVQMTEVLAVHEDAGWWPNKRSLYGEEVVENLERAAGFSALDHHRALAHLQELKEDLLGVFESVDVIVLPTTPIPAPTPAGAERREPGSFRRPVVSALTRFCAPANAADLAAMSLPAGTTADGRPLGIQFVGRTESHVLEAGRRWESAT